MKEKLQKSLQLLNLTTDELSKKIYNLTNFSTVNSSDNQQLLLYKTKYENLKNENTRLQDELNKKQEKINFALTEIQQLKISLKNKLNGVE